MQIAENGVTEVSKTKAVSTKDMTPEEYKQYIHNDILQIPLHPSRMLESISFNISDAVFKAMQNNKVIYSRKHADLLQSYGMEQVDVISNTPSQNGYAIPSKNRLEFRGR